MCVYNDVTCIHIKHCNCASMKKKYEACLLIGFLVYSASKRSLYFTSATTSTTTTTTTTTTPIPTTTTTLATTTTDLPTTELCEDHVPTDFCLNQDCSNTDVYNDFCPKTCGACGCKL